MFDKKGQIYMDAEKYDEDSTLEAALDAGAEDFSREGEQYIVSTTPYALHAVQDGLRARKIGPTRPSWRWFPRTPSKSRARTRSESSVDGSAGGAGRRAKVSSNFDIDASQLAEASA